MKNGALRRTTAGIPFFSAVVPTYNRSKLVQRAISSILAQSFQGFEIIVVDNSSTDNTRETIESLDDPRISIITVQNEGIIAYSRNRGIKEAKGEWVAFLDDDDVWLPEKLETVYSEIQKNSDIILLCSDVMKVIDGTRDSIQKCAPKSQNIYESLLFHRNGIVTSSVVLRRENALKTGGFSEKRDYVSVEDVDYWIRLSNEGDFRFINKPLTELHFHDGRGTRDPNLHATASLCMGEYYLDLWLKDHPGSGLKVRIGRGKRLAGAGRLYLKASNFSKAGKLALHSIILYPLLLVKISIRFSNSFW